MALINAAKDGRTEDVKVLIERGADVDAKDSVSRGGGLHYRNECRYSATIKYSVVSCNISLPFCLF
jgi:hypothetical protein